MSTAAAAAPSDEPRSPTRTMVRTATAGVAVAVLGLLLLLPLFPREPAFALVTVAVAGAVAALGGSLAQDGQRLCAFAMVFAGVLWLALAVDVHVPWGPVVSWTSTGLPAAALGCVLVHYRRRHPQGLLERALPVVGLGLTLGVRLAMLPFVDPTALGFPPGAWWPAPWPGALSAVDALEISRASLCVLLAYVAVLGWRSLHPPHARRGRRWPVLVAGTALAAAAAVVQLLAMVLAGALDRHASATATGAVVLLFVAVVPLLRAARHGFGVGSGHRLPRVRTPETATGYLREITGDPTAELLYRSPDGGLLDATGHRRSAVEETRPERFWTWVRGADGEHVALLVGHPDLGGDHEALREWLRAAAVLAESVRPTVLLRTRLARLTALRVADELARAEERERFRRDLHDGLHQTIAAARMDLDGLHDVALSDPDGAEAVIAGLEAKMAVALDQVRSLGGVAAPPEPDAGLDAAIDRAATALRLTPRVSVTGTRVGVLALPVFLLVREALTNVAKHAGAAAVDVRVHCDGRTVEIAVSDDGRGGAVVGDGGGIGGMRARVEELGGTLVLESPPDGGTALRASIPCV